MRKVKATPETYMYICTQCIKRTYKTEGDVCMCTYDCMYVYVEVISTSTYTCYLGE